MQNDLIPCGEQMEIDDIIYIHLTTPADAQLPAPPPPTTAVSGFDTTSRGATADEEPPVPAATTTAPPPPTSTDGAAVLAPALASTEGTEAVAEGPDNTIPVLAPTFKTEGVPKVAATWIPDEVTPAAVVPAAGTEARTAALAAGPDNDDGDDDGVESAVAFAGWGIAGAAAAAAVSEEDEGATSILAVPGATFGDRATVAVAVAVVAAFAPPAAGWVVPARVGGDDGVGSAPAVPAAESTDFIVVFAGGAGAAVPVTAALGEGLVVADGGGGGGGVGVATGGGCRSCDRLLGGSAFLSERCSSKLT